MKKILNHRLYLPLFIMIVALLSACKKNVETPPVISEVRSYVASPNDTAINGLVVNDQIKDGQWVVISGQNLKNATQIKFDGVNAAFNGALFAQNNAVVRIPTILFSTIDTTKLYTIEYTTLGGSTTFSFKLGPPKPTITAISNVFANPGDSVFLYGANLVLVQSLSYAGSPITSFKSDLYGTSLGFKMPAQQPTDRVLLTTKTGSVDFKIVATPTITGVSNENAAAGDSVYVYGTYLKNIQIFNFGGAAITSFQSSADGSSVAFKMPSISTTAPVSITTQFGTATTLYKVNDIGSGTGSMSNWEWGGNFNWQWWGGANLYSGDPNSGWPPFNADFPGNPSLYMVLKNSILISGEGNTWSNYAIRMDAKQWVAAGNMNDPIDNWAFKFEVNIPQPWNGGSIVIESADNTYIGRWEPWQTSATTTAPYTTNGWKTITLPFSVFRKKDATLGDGKGASMTKFADLLGASGNSACTMYIHNYSASSTATGFYGAFDNLRVVKIK
jgi:hypothetical protein